MSPNDIRLRIFGDFEMVQSIEEWTKRKKQLSKQETIMKICLFDIIPLSKNLEDKCTRIDYRQQKRIS